MLTCSIGPLLSPTAQAIMEEISEKYEKESNISLSFADIYSKYVEANEQNKTKKVGRTRSFGHTDMFQRPNVLNNREIDMYKYDLEVEIGIRKPKGLYVINPKKSKIRNNTENKTLQEVVDCPPSTVLTDDAKGKKYETPLSIQVDNNDNVEKNESEVNKKRFQQPSLQIIVGNNQQNYDEEKYNESPTIRKNSEEIIKMRLENAKNALFQRSVSVPHHIMNVTSRFEPEEKKKGILFGYDKKLLDENKKNNNCDIVFEEFEISENFSDKSNELKSSTGKKYSKDDMSILKETNKKFHFEEEEENNNNNNNEVKKIGEETVADIENRMPAIDENSSDVANKNNNNNYQRKSNGDIFIANESITGKKYDDNDKIKEIETVEENNNNIPSGMDAIRLVKDIPNDETYLGSFLVFKRNRF